IEGPLEGESARQPRVDAADSRRHDALRPRQENDCRVRARTTIAKGCCRRYIPAFARCRNLSGLRTTYSARINPFSISKAEVCIAPSGASTTTPGRPLIVAKRTVKS